ncbi:lumazine synthase RIB4 [Sporobolomyces koalae]|uniref:lumazine synthase RIB4 n=1 Tax=Sporobolomyces koalae TaxID=500713 RepID=UPI00317A5A6D
MPRDGANTRDYTLLISRSTEASPLDSLEKQKGMTDHTIKGLGAPPEQFDGSPHRILIVHARWNADVISPLVEGCIETMIKSGVQRDNIVIETVPGSYELPMACSRLIAASQIQASANASNLMGSTSLLDSTTSPTSASSPTSKGPFSAAIAIGVLIKGSTQHFEYISESVSHGLMRVQLDTGVPVIYGVLNCNTDEQALVRAGVGRGQDKGHNHGEDWGAAAVELAVKTARWQQGSI